jgi:hypothetical protein
METLFNKLKSDSWGLGILLGLLLPLIVYALLVIVINFTGLGLARANAMLLSVFINLFTFRYYMVSLNFDRTGRGILLVTFALVAFYFFFFL